MATGGIPVFAAIPGQGPAVTIPNTVSLNLIFYFTDLPIQLDYVWKF